MIERIRAALRQRAWLGVGISLLVHLALVLALLWAPPGRAPGQKRGDALIVELPNLDEPANRGTPGPAPDAAPAPAASAPPARTAPPASRPPSRPPAAARPPAPKAEPRETPRAVAKAPDIPRAERGDVPAPAPATPAESARPEPVRPEPATPPAPPAVASAPPSASAPVAPVPPDIRSALRRGGGGGGSGAGGAGGLGTGRGGIEGEPVALDSKDPDFNDYLERVRALVKKHWSYPCVKNTETRECEFKNGQLVIQFGILRDGRLGFLELDRSTGFPIMDEFAANAIKLASPFPPLPAALMANRKGTGLPIRARFNYVVETGLTNVLR